MRSNSKQGLRIAFDFDGVIAETAREKLSWLAESAGIHILGNSDRSSLVPQIGEEMYAKLQLATGFRDTLEALPVDGAVAGLNFLRRHFQIHVVTARPHDKVVWVGRWLDENQLSWLSEAVHSSTGALKASVARSLGCSIMVDNDIRHLVVATNVEIRRILFGPGSIAACQNPSLFETAETWPELRRYLLATPAISASEN